MATFTEVSVRVELRLRRDPVTGDRIIVRATSVTSEGPDFRTEENDITAELNAADKASITALLDKATNRYKTTWSIP